MGDAHILRELGESTSSPPISLIPLSRMTHRHHTISPTTRAKKIHCSTPQGHKPKRIRTAPTTQSSTHPLSDELRLLGLPQARRREATRESSRQPKRRPPRRTCPSPLPAAEAVAEVFAPKPTPRRSRPASERPRGLGVAAACRVGGTPARDSDDLPRFNLDDRAAAPAARIVSPSFAASCSARPESRPPRRRPPSRVLDPLVWSATTESSLSPTALATGRSPTSASLRLTPKYAMIGRSTSGSRGAPGRVVLPDSTRSGPRPETQSVVQKLDTPQSSAGFDPADRRAGTFLPTVAVGVDPGD